VRETGPPLPPLARRKEGTSTIRIIFSSDPLLDRPDIILPPCHSNEDIALDAMTPLLFIMVPG